MKRMVMILAVILVVLWGSQALAATKWYSAGYGKHGPSWGNFNELIEGYNSWTQALGLSDFEIKELESSVTTYSLGSRWEFSPHWEIDWSTIIFNPGAISESQEETFLLEGGSERWLQAGSEIRYFITTMDLMGYYFFKPDSRIRPFIGAGFTYWTASFSGYYYASEQVYTPPWDYENRYLSQDFSVSGSRLGYVLGTGIDSALGKHFRVGLKVEHRWIPSMEFEVNTYNEGFSSLPESSSINISARGWSGAVYLMFRF